MPSALGTVVSMATTSDPAARLGEVRSDAGLPVRSAEIARIAGRGRFLIGHVLVLAVAASMVELGRWQWHVAHARHGAIQNYAYAFQWWIFAVFGIAMWIRIMRDKAAHERDQRPGAAGTGDRRTPEAPAGYRAYAMPQSAGITADQRDDVLAEYNDYLARYGQPPPANEPATGVQP